MKNLISTAVIVASLALLAGCKNPPPEQPTQTQQPTTDTSAVDNANAVMDDTATAGPSGELLSKRIVYFDFDRADIRAGSRAGVAGNGPYLPKNPSRKVGLEGHADERGSREYNIGLGERRGQAVRRALLLQGVAEGQLSTGSYGEERPAVAVGDEQAYAAKRRVEIVYLK